MVKTRVLTDRNGGLSIPVFDGAYNNGEGRFLSEPEILRNSILELMFDPVELQSLVVVKVDTKEPNAKHLRNRVFEDGEKRYLAFSSGKSYYFAGANLTRQLRKLFETEPDTACRYGSLLVSDCFKGSATLECLRVKIVDYQDPQFAEFQTGDCHGKISPCLAKQLGGHRRSPFQFRFAWRADWAAGTDADRPQVSFLAKGTFLPDVKLTADKGYDLILDRSSIKGINKAELKQLIPCGDYEFPRAVIGNRSNAKVTEYNNSWQFTIWFSEDAVRQDFGDMTRQEAEKLADLQRDPLALAKYIVNEYDKDQERRAVSENELEDEEGGNGDRTQESRMIAILRADKYGQLIDAPKIADFLRNYVAKRWRDLAVRTGFTHSSGMALPAPELERGTICAPHLPEGDTIVTRYPIVSKDNIRLYHNVHGSELTKTRNVVWIHPKDAEEFHQADFDGDQLIVTPASKCPHIAEETLRAVDPGEYVTVKQRPKVAYTKVLNENGERKYKNLAQIAAASSQNKVGLIATYIGRVQSSIPNEEEHPKLFERKQKALLNRLITGLQPEVDYQKSAERLEDIAEIDGKNLIADARRWSESHPCHFFDFQKDDRSYRVFTIPADEPTAVNVMPREIVNPLWQATQIRNRSREEFRYLFPSPKSRKAREVSYEDLETIEAWEATYLNWAEELKTRFEEARAEIQERVGDDIEAFNKELGKVYETYRAEVEELFPDSEERFQAASALWYSQHSRPERKGAEDFCLKIAKQLKPTFALEYDYELPGEALPRDVYVLRFPFGHEALKWKRSLDEKSIAYDAIVSSELPMIEFVFQDLSPKIVEKLEARYGNNINDPDKLKLPEKVWIVPPQDHNWATSRVKPGVGALVYNVFTDEICQQLQELQINEIQILGIRYNDFANEDFTAKRWRKPVSLQVGTLKREPDDPDYYRYNGMPAVEIEGQTLGTFSPDTPKLPVGTMFEAMIERDGSKVILHVNPDSIRLPEMENANHKLTNRDRDQQEAIFDKLVQGIEAAYQQDQTLNPDIDISKPRQIKVGRWDAYLDVNGECSIRGGLPGRPKKVICRFNLQTKEVTQPLSSENVAEFERMLEQSKQQSQQITDITTRNQQLHNQTGIKKQIEIN
jgi:hypothetical protein